MIHNDLRPLWGYRAKKAGREYPVVQDPTFEEAVRNAHYWRIRCNPELAYLLRGSYLPLAHYYVYGDVNPKVVPTRGHEWQVAHLEHLRFCLQWT